ncbi:diguanylate cyclase domain-containing protein [Desulfoplanes sp.]
MKKQILIVDDSPEDREFYQRFMRKIDGETILLEAETGEEALGLLVETTPGLIIVDYNLPDMNGVELLSYLPRKNDRPTIPVILLTGQGNEAVAVAAMKNGARDYLIKGEISEDSFCKAIQRVVKEHEIERKLEENRTFLDTLIKTIPNPIFYKDKNGKYQGANPAFEKMLGIDQSVLVGKTTYDLVDKDFARKCEKMDTFLLKSGGQQQYELPLDPESGAEKALLFNKSVYHDGSGKIAGIIGVITDITERKKYETKIYQLAMFDQLTGAASRSHFLECLTNAFKRVKRNNKYLAVLYLDLDGFKEINDIYGHRAGDAVLQESARRMMTMLRETDTLGRMGGDEFTILIENLNSQKDAVLVTEKILDVFKHPFHVAQGATGLSASIGVSFASANDGMSPDQMVSSADKAMYRAKTSGKNRYSLSQPD